MTNRSSCVLVGMICLFLSSCVTVVPLPTTNTPVIINSEQKANQDRYKGRITSWKFERRCDIFHACLTEFYGAAEVFDSTNGTTIQWNRAESWTQDDCGANPQDNRWYKKVENAKSIPFGWGTKDGESHHGSVYFAFYNDDFKGTWLIKTTSCN